MLDFDPDDIARQMTVIDSELFQRVDVSWSDWLLGFECYHGDIPSLQAGL